MTYPVPADKEIAFPHAKINIGLFVTRRRADGYHVLQSLFYPIGWHDALEILPAGGVGTCRLTTGGIAVEGDAESNLVVRAYRLLQRRFPDLPGVEIHLEKRIPTGAGLGGGSSDGAHALRMIARLYDLPLGDAEIEADAARLGADCVFFCRQGAQYLDGVGPELTPHPFSLRGRHIVIVKPPVGVSTREAYAHVMPHAPAVPLLTLLQHPIEAWRDAVVNDFEPSVFPLHPELASVKAELYRRGALYASMSGSGAALFGIFDTAPTEAAAWFPAAYATRTVEAEW